MSVPWKNVLKFGLGVLEAVVPQVHAIEVAVETVGKLTGKDKQDAVVAIVKNSLELAEGFTDRDLLNDPEVETATRAVIDAVVAFHNIVAKRKADLAIQ